MHAFIVSEATGGFIEATVGSSDRATGDEAPYYRTDSSYSIKDFIKGEPCIATQGSGAERRTELFGVRALYADVASTKEQAREEAFQQLRKEQPDGPWF